MKLSAALPRHIYFPRSSAYDFAFRPRQRFVVHLCPQPSMIDTVRTLQTPLDAFFQDPFELDSFLLRESPFMKRREKVIKSFFRDFDSADDQKIRRKNLSTPCEVTEKPDSFEVSITLPTGMEAKDISLELLHDDQVLYLSGEYKLNEGNSLRLSRISRMIKMGNNMDTNKISAKLSDGVLHVTVPKLAKREEKQSKKIEIVQDSLTPVAEKEVGNEQKEDVKGCTDDEVAISKSESVESENEEDGSVIVEDDNDDAKAKKLDASNQEH